jgi:hypothetical protein
MSRPRLLVEEYGEILGYPRYVVRQGRSIATGADSLRLIDEKLDRLRFDL